MFAHLENKNGKSHKSKLIPKLKIHITAVISMFTHTN